MTHQKKENADKYAAALRLTGRLLVGAVGVVLILAGILKLLNVGAEDMLEGLEKASLLQHKNLISGLAISCGALLAAPRIWKFGVLPSSSYWGGAIVAHLTYNDSFLMPAAFLTLMWIGLGLALRFDSDAPPNAS